MKLINKAFIIALTGVLAAGMTACSSDNNTENDGPLEVSPSSLEFDAEGGDLTVEITGKGWKATKDVEWVGIQNKEGEIVVTTIPNDAKEQRSGAITIKNNNDTKTVAVTQRGLSTLSVVSELTLAGGGETKTVTVTSETAWEATTQADWLEITKGDGSFTVTAGVNEGEERSATIIVENEEDSATIAVTQSGRGVRTHVFDTATGEFLGLLNRFGGNSQFTVELSSEGYPDEDGARLTMYILVPDADITYAKDQFSLPTKMDYTFRNIPLAYAVDMTSDEHPTRLTVSENGNVVELSIAPGKDSKMKVEGDSAGYTITFDLILTDGSSFKASYTGPIDIENPNPGPDVIPSDTDLDDMYIGLFRYYPREYSEFSADAFLIHGHTENLGTEGGYYVGTGWLFRTQILTEMVDDGIIPDGTYNVVELTAENAAPWVARGSDSYVAYLEEGYMLKREYLRNGTVTSTYSDDSYTFEIDVYVQSGRHITGTIEGVPPPFVGAPLLP